MHVVGLGSQLLLVKSGFFEISEYIDIQGNQLSSNKL
jgi:hypothetical protein